MEVLQLQLLLLLLLLLLTLLLLLLLTLLLLLLLLLLAVGWQGLMQRAEEPLKAVMLRPDAPERRQPPFRKEVR